jgi:hypothetical protein
MESDDFRVWRGFDITAAILPIFIARGDEVTIGVL